MADRNGVPSRDGEITEYRNPEAEATRWFDPGRRAVFVNGMANTGKNHAESGLALSLLQMCPVIGLYNLTGGFFEDLSQCLLDKYQWDGPRAASPSEILDAIVADAARRGQRMDRAAAMEKALERNPAAASLFRLLRRPEYRQAAIFAHSQGNLILSNTLSAIGLVDGETKLGTYEVRTFGSPAVNWPRGVKPIECGFTWDPVTWLAGFDFSFSISKVGMPADSLNPLTHGFAEYMKCDPAFVINRFRWGSLGVTVSMDEDGLATALVRMGRNLPRVRSVFERLKTHHPSDSDDVALLYVEKLRRGTNGAAVLGALKSEPALRKLLIDVMDGGWTTAREKEAIRFLRAL
ncbi:MAG TPA: hypothetical protein VKU85_07625 [bacterium]|nr:hypothetical protein [bacterium]